MSDDLVISKEALLKTGLTEEKVTVDGLGTVRIRSLSRAEYLRLRKSDQEDWEIGIVAAGLVEPALNEDEVREWHGTVGPRPFDDLAGEVLRVSGLRPARNEPAPEHAKPAVEDAKATFPEGPGA